VTFIESEFPSPDTTQDRVGPAPERTLDLESTSDLNRAQEHSTRDLAPATGDVETGDIGPEVVSHSLTSAFAPPAVAETLGPGTVLADRFLVERLLGSGGTSIVYQARDMASSTGTAPNKRIALKVPRSDVTDHARGASRLRHEFQITQRLAHPNIVKVLELYEEPQQCFMTMELIEGKLLSTFVRDWTLLSRPLAYKIIRSCGHALAHAHSREVVHGDFKPGNVFITRDEQVKVLDFGAAAATSGDASLRIPAGTPAYASPEVLDGATPDRRDDVFSFACVAYEMLTGQHPFDHLSSLEARAQGKTPQRPWNLSAPQWLALLSALSWERAQRPDDVANLAGALVPESAPVAEAVPIQPTLDIVSRELPPELMQPQRGWGFFLFLACAVAVIFVASQRQSEPDPVEEEVASTAPATPIAALPLMGKAVDSVMQQAAVTKASIATSSDDTTPSPEAAGSASVVAPKPAPTGPLSQISFEDRAIVTSEGSVAAVFLVKRSQPLRGRARINWSTQSGTADAGIDFASSASGTIEFADGQAQRAIYVPLRADLLKEEDETFTVKLHGAQNARVGTLGTVEATIRDDD
jgi:serine/threonine protein kinase